MRIKFSSLLALLIIALCVPTTMSCRRTHLREGSRSRETTHSRGTGCTRAERPGKQKQVITMRPDNGVYYVPVKVNGADMEFILDTGASIVCLSVVEAAFLYRQGKLTQDDIVGAGQFIDASGRVNTNVMVKLRDVTLGGITIHDVEASISESQRAPLLLGQTVLSRFGSVTIDYNRNQIILNN